MIQTSISIADQANIDSVLPAARKHNVGVMAKRPIANAAWLGASGRPGLLRQLREALRGPPDPDEAEARRRRLPRAGSHAWPELALRFTLSQPGVHCAIIGTTNPENARANIAYAEKGPLPQDAVAKVRQAFRKADPTRAWVGLT